MSRQQLSSEFLQYLATVPLENGHSPLSEPGHLPSLNELSKQLNVSVASLREQLEVARAMGLVEVRPRTGIRRLPYTFTPAVSQSLSYAIQVDPSNFVAFSELRNHVEAAFWDQAVRALAPEDHQQLQSLMARAWEKLRGNPIQIPHAEHRLLHLCVFGKLGNPFVLGLLEAYWEAYEAVGLNVYADYGYLREVWTYHQKMVDAILAGDFNAGYQALVEHTDLLHHRPYPGEAAEPEVNRVIASKT